MMDVRPGSWLERLILRRSPGLRRLDAAIARLEELQLDRPVRIHLDDKALAVLRRYYEERS